MAETVGFLLIDAIVGSASITGVGSAAVTLEVAGVALTAAQTASIVGTAAILATSIGLSYALSSRPDTPKPESGSRALKQAVPPRLRGYGVNRLAGFYFLYDADNPSPALSFDVVGFHSGEVGSIDSVYLSDDLAPLDADPNLGGVCNVVLPTPGGEYVGYVVIQCRLGTVNQGALDALIGNPLIDTKWTAAHRGRGIAHAAIVCFPRSDPSDYANTYPRGCPEASFVCHCSPCWDVRSGAQDRLTPSTWTVSTNPVIQLIDYLTRADGGMGLDYVELIYPNIDQWIAQANICDEIVTGGVPRYASHGWFYFDNNPSDIIGKLLSTCDGWLASNGDGSLSLVVGKYATPSDPPITTEDILGFSIDCGVADEELINQLDVTYTNPFQKYVQDQLAPVRDEVSISQGGIVRAKPLDLTWVQDASQATRLGYRALQRVNPIRKGTIVTTLLGMRWLGKRWVRLQFPLIAHLHDCFIEIQDAETDLMAGRVTFTWALVDPATLAAL